MAMTAVKFSSEVSLLKLLKVWLQSRCKGRWLCKESEIQTDRRGKKDSSWVYHGAMMFQPSMPHPMRLSSQKGQECAVTRWNLTWWKWRRGHAGWKEVHKLIPPQNRWRRFLFSQLLSAVACKMRLKVVPSSQHQPLEVGYNLSFLLCEPTWLSLGGGQNKR